MGGERAILGLGEMLTGLIADERYAQDLDLKAVREASWFVERLLMN